MRLLPPWRRSRPPSLLVLAGCGVTGDELDEAGTTTTSSTSTTTEPDESSTTTEPESTTTTEERPGDENDPELEALLLTEDDFGVELEIDPDADDAGFDDEEFCEGQNFTVLPIAQAAIGFDTADLETVVVAGDRRVRLRGRRLAVPRGAPDAQRGLQGRPTTTTPSRPPSSRSTDLGDEAIRALPDPGAEGLEVIVVRAGERIILLAAFGDEPILDNPLIIEAVDRATPA